MHPLNFPPPPPSSCVSFPRTALRDRAVHVAGGSPTRSSPMKSAGEGGKRCREGGRARAGWNGMGTLPRLSEQLPTTTARTTPLSQPQQHTTTHLATTRTASHRSLQPRTRPSHRSASHHLSLCRTRSRSLTLSAASRSALAHPRRLTPLDSLRQRSASRFGCSSRPLGAQLSCRSLHTPSSA